MSNEDRTEVFGAAHTQSGFRNATTWTYISMLPQLDEICNSLFDPAVKLMYAQLRELLVA